MKVSSAQDVSNVSSWEELRRFSSQAITSIMAVLNGKVGFNDNLDCIFQDVTFGAAGQEQAVQHRLGRVPLGYIAVKSSAAVLLYNGTKENTDSVLNLRANAAGTVTILIF